MAQKKVSFEDNLNKLEEIVNKLESGNIPLDQALTEFKAGVQLSNKLQSSLSNAEHTLTKMMTKDGKEVPYDRDKNGKDVSNTVKNDSTDSQKSGNTKDPFTN